VNREDEDEKNCKCGDEAGEDHPCPYSQEIHGDDRECNCCEFCTQQCAMEI
jgi:hypothetical protein